MSTLEQQRAVEMYIRQYEHDISGFALWLLSSTAQSDFRIPFVTSERDQTLQTMVEVYPTLSGKLQFIVQQGLLNAFSNVEQTVESPERSATLRALVRLAFATRHLSKELRLFMRRYDVQD